MSESASWTVAPPRARRPEDVEALLCWAYAAQKVDLMLGRGLADQEAELETGFHGSSPDSLVWLERIATLGCRVDGSGVAMSADVHPDAAAIHDAVMRLDRPVAQLVMRHARDRTRPDWGAGLRPRFRPLMGRKGNPLIVYDASDKGRHYGHCPIEWMVDRKEIETRRGVYSMWRRALREIGIELLRAGKLVFVSPTGPAAPAVPWCHERLDFERSA